MSRGCAACDRSASAGTLAPMLRPRAIGTYKCSSARHSGEDERYQRSEPVAMAVSVAVLDPVDDVVVVDSHRGLLSG